VATDPGSRPGLRAEVDEAVDRLNAVVGRPGYVTETFCLASRYFRPENGARIDAVRDVIESEYAGTDLWPVLVTSLLEAADRVDSTTGLQMAYLKQWAARSLHPLVLRAPVLVNGPGHAVQGDACALVGSAGLPEAQLPEAQLPEAQLPEAQLPEAQLPEVDLAYLDPPYNQHRYDSNYHVWETIVAWDAPSFYGVACKRDDLRDPERRSAFNGRRTMPAALAQVVSSVRAEVMILSYNNESWLSFDELHALCSARGQVAVLAFDSARYVGARIGIHNPAGRKVGTVSHLRNTEYVLVAGERSRVKRMVGAVADAGLGQVVDRPVPVVTLADEAADLAGDSGAVVPA
jgi:adenine-specific DNA-methyltransferase